MSRRLWENLISLYGVQFLSVVAPLILLPYLARVLGPVHWGELAFAEAFSIYVYVLVEYGFGFSASREVAQARHDLNLRTRQVAGVIGAQGILAGSTLALALVPCLVVPALAPYRALLPFGYLLGALRAACPIWYFQGLERMRFVALLNVTANLAAVAAIVVLVRSPGDAWISLLLRSGTTLLCLAIMFAMVYRETPLLRPTCASAWQTLRGGSSIFLFNSAVTLYSTANVLLLGLLAPAGVVAWFAGAERVTKAALAGITPITQTFYPRISYQLKHEPDRARRTALLSLGFTMAVGLAAGVTDFLYAPLLVRWLLGPGYQQSVPVLRLLAPLPLIMAVSIALGVQWLFPLRLELVYCRMIVLGGLLNIVLAFILVPRVREIGMATGVMTAELFVMSGVVFELIRRRIGPWNRLPQGPELSREVESVQV